MPPETRTPAIIPTAQARADIGSARATLLRAALDPESADHLTAAADLARQRAAEAITDGTPEDAERALTMAGHLERLAFNHRAAATCQRRPELDPAQCEPERA